MILYLENFAMSLSQVEVEGVQGAHAAWSFNFFGKEQG